MNLPRNFQNIQILRGIAALMVLLLHINGGEEQYSGPRGLLPASFDIGHSGVDLFFLISGFVMVYATRSPDKQNPLDFIRTRLVRIYPVYWLVMAVTVLLFVMKGILFHELTDFSNVYADLLLIPTGKLPILSVAWTLVHEMYFYLVFMISLFLLRRHLVWLLMIWLFLLTVGTSTGMNNVHPVANIVFHPLTVEFIVGACIGLLILDGVQSGGKTALGVGCVWLVSIAIWRMYVDADPYPSNWRRVLLSMPPMALILYGAVVLELKGDVTEGRWRFRSFFMQLGDASYVLYLLHLPVLLVIGKLWKPFVTPQLWDNGLLILFWTVGSVGVALIVHRWVEKPMLRRIRRNVTITSDPNL